MKVAQLIAELQKCDAAAEVYMPRPDEDGGRWYGHRVKAIAKNRYVFDVDTLNECKRCVVIIGPWTLGDDASGWKLGNAAAECPKCGTRMQIKIPESQP